MRTATPAPPVPAPAAGRGERWHRVRARRSRSGSATAPPASLAAGAAHRKHCRAGTPRAPPAAASVLQFGPILPQRLRSHSRFHCCPRHGAPFWSPLVCWYPSLAVVGVDFGKRRSLLAKPDPGAQLGALL